MFFDTFSDSWQIYEQVKDHLSHWRKKFGECALEALEEIMFNDLYKNDTAN
jgi:hypothetical protein